LILILKCPHSTHVIYHDLARPQMTSRDPSQIPKFQKSRNSIFSKLFFFIFSTVDQISSNCVGVIWGWWLFVFIEKFFQI